MWIYIAHSRKNASNALNPPLLRLTSRKLLWLDLQPVDIKSRWRHNWKSAQVVNSHLVCDPTIRQPSSNLARQQWSLLNCFCTEQGHCGACRSKSRLTDTDLCPCGETQTMFHIVESSPLTKLNGGLSRLHSADEDVSWLTSYGSWCTYKKKNRIHERMWQTDTDRWTDTTLMHSIARQKLCNSHTHPERNTIFTGQADF